MKEQITDVKAVRIIKGKPWKDAVISVLEPRSPYRPWSGADRVEPGDAVVAVLDTEPVSVLAGIGIIGDDGDVHNAIAGIDRFYLNGLLELGTLNMLAGFVIRPGQSTVFQRRSPKDVVATIGDYTPSTVEALFGHTSLAAGRVLLQSEGRCTACHCQLDLIGDDARSRVHIHTANPFTDEPAPETTGIWDHTRQGLSDWPAALCDPCHAKMYREGFASFLDFRFSLHPRCPKCAAQHSMSAMYGMPAGPVEEPWIATMGCVVTEPRAEWVCGECRHEWR
jgi:hypothetical protein